MENINFKISRELAEELDRLAEKYNERSRHLYARRAVEEYLKNSRQHQIEYSLREIRDEIEKLREELSTATGVLLLKSGKVQTMEEAMEWVRTTFCP